MTGVGKFAVLFSLATALAVCPAPTALAGPDDDARLRRDAQGNVVRNSVDPILNPPGAPGGNLLADFPTNAEPTTGLRLLPPTGTQLLVGQRFDLRVETQIPTGSSTPTLRRLTVNGSDLTARFTGKIASQGAGIESGTPDIPGLYGATARNLSFERAGVYTVTATVSANGRDYTITNTYPVAATAFDGSVRHVVFFLGDAMGLPIRTAARIAGKGIFEGRARGRLHLDRMDEYGLVSTSSFDSVITDSAPGMASYVTGLKQANNALNVAPDNTPNRNLDNPRVETLWQFLKRTRGWKIGAVSDAYLTDATPAATVAHTRSRSDRTAIAQQMLGEYRDGSAQPITGFQSLRALAQPLDVLMGGGARDFLPANHPLLSDFYREGPRGRTDGLDLVAAARSRGYSTVKSLAELQAAPDNKPLLGLFVGDFRPSSALGADNIPGTLDRLVAAGRATIGGRTATDPALGLSAAVAGTAVAGAAVTGAAVTGAAVTGAATTCGTTVQECFRTVPFKRQMVDKAIRILDRLAGPKGGWALLVEQSQIDKLAHPLEYERVIYEALELDEALGAALAHPLAPPASTLTIATADHAQPETIVGVALPGAVAPDGATPPGGCFSTSPDNSYPITLGSAGDSRRPCPLQDVVGTFNDATFPTYTDAGDGYPDDPDPTVKLVLEDGGRPTYSQDYRTNPVPQNPSGANASLPNPERDPNGILLTGNLATRNVLPTQPAPNASLPGASANKTGGSTGVAPHAGDDVPLSASGRGAELFGGSYENTEVHVRLGLALSGRTSRRTLRVGSPYSGVPNTAPPGNHLQGF